MPPRKSPYLTPWPERSGTSEWGYSVWLNDSFCAGFASVSVWKTKFRADIASFPVSLPSPSPRPCGSKRGKRPRDKPKRGSRLTGQVQFSRFPTTSVYDARGVAQTGSAFGSGPKGQGFKSLHPDQLSQRSRCPQGQRIFCFKAGVKEWSTSWYGRSSGGAVFSSQVLRVWDSEAEIRERVRLASAEPVFRAAFRGAGGTAPAVRLRASGENGRIIPTY